ELTSGRDWAWDPNTRQAPADYPVDDSESDITALMWNGVGGGTVVFAAHWQRNMPSDFQVRSLDGIADDWPFTYEALEPYYQRATCLWGCSEGAKASVDRTYWPVAVERGVTLLTGARVKRLVVGPDGLVTGALYVDRDGNEHMQQAAVTILACNGIGTPRLLLLSATNAQPNGLGNSSGLVGKRLMMHPFGTVVGLFDDDLDS